MNSRKIILLIFGILGASIGFAQTPTNVKALRFLTLGTDTAAIKAAATEGTMFYNPVSDKLRLLKGSTWVTVGEGSGGGGGAVADVFGRTGSIIAQSGDYTFSQIGSKPTTISGYGITDAVNQSFTVNSQALTGSGITLTKSNIGLSNVDNTPDASKPVSTAQQTAIDAKVADVITDGVTTVAPSENAVFDGLATKAPATSGTSILKGNGSGGFSNATGGTDYLTPTGSAAGLISFPTLNQNTTGSASTLTTPRNIYGNPFDGSTALTQIIGSAFGGTGNGFAKLFGPATSEKTFTLPNASATILTDNAVVTVAQGGTGLQTATANYGFRGPSSGSNAAPAFRQDVTADLPFDTHSTQSGTTYTLLASDKNTFVHFTNSSAITVTLTTGISNGYSVGIVKDGAGDITFVTSGGATFSGATVLTGSAPQIAVIKNKGSDAWFSNNTSTNVAAMGALDGQSPATNGATIVNGLLYLQGADQTHAGLINTTTQTIAGNKTLDGNLILKSVGQHFAIKEGTNGWLGRATLVSGTISVTVSGVTSSTECFITRRTPSGTSLTVEYDCSCSTNTVTIQADVAAGTINTADGSTFSYHLIDPAP